MRFPALLVLFFASCAWGAADPSLSGIKTIYLMPMGNGLDQYLANQIAARRIFQVVTDPMLADAIVSDRIGNPFEQAFAQLYPPPPPPPEKAEPKKDDKADPAVKKNGSTTLGAALADRPDVPPRATSFAPSRGNVFIIDRKSRRILWSEFRRPKNSQPEEINNTASKMVSHLEKDLTELQNPVK